MCEARRQLNLEAMIVGLFLERNDFGSAIDVSLHEVSAQAIAGAKGALEINRAAAAECFEICPLEGLLKQIEPDVVARASADSETASIYGDAVTSANGFADAWRDDLQLRALIRGAVCADAADFFDKTGEHRSFLTARNQPANQQKHWQQNGQRKFQDESDETRRVHFMLLGDGLDHEIWAVADVSDRA